MKNYIGYLRVSTQRQGQSGLGLEAQKTMIKSYINGDSNLVDSYVEIESGKNDKRVELMKAIEHAKLIEATLVIAKLDRLSRNASFIFTLRDSGVQFVAVDMPQANTLNIGILAIMAQYEREQISDRTKRALAEKKRQGVKLGSPNNLTLEARKKGVVARQNKAADNENNRRAIALISSLYEAGMSYRQMATRLNESGYKSSKGKSFQAMTVKRLLDRDKCDIL